MNNDEMAAAARELLEQVANGIPETLVKQRAVGYRTYIVKLENDGADVFVNAFVETGRIKVEVSCGRYVKAAKTWRSAYGGVRSTPWPIRQIREYALELLEERRKRASALTDQRAERKARKALLLTLKDAEGYRLVVNNEPARREDDEDRLKFYARRDGTVDAKGKDPEGVERFELTVNGLTLAQVQVLLGAAKAVQS
jgi:hypothetical protein